MDKEKRIKELVEILNKAGYVYYQQGEEIMSNKEYDALYDELVKLEEETRTLNTPITRSRALPLLCALYVTYCFAIRGFKLFPLDCVVVVVCNKNADKS